MAGSSLTKPLGKKRIAFVGDSLTFGLWADKVENSFVGVFDSLLSPESFEVLNFGVNGYGLDDEELIIKEEVMRFAPDYLVLMFFNGNDFRDTYLGIDKYDISSGRPVYDMDNLRNKVPEQFLGLSQRVREPEHSLSTRGYLARHTATYRVFYGFKEVFKRKSAKSEFPFSHDFKVASEFTSFTFWSQVPYPDVAIRARDVSLETLARINSYISQKDVQLIIVTIPFPAQVYSNDKVGENYDIHLPQKYIEEFARVNNIPYLDLLPHLRAFIRENNESIFNDGEAHFNNEGHYIVGLLLHNFIRNIIER